MTMLVAVLGALCIGASVASLAAATNLGGIGILHRRRRLADLVAIAPSSSGSPVAGHRDAGPSLVSMRAGALSALAGLVVAVAAGSLWVGILAAAAVPVGRVFVRRRQLQTRNRDFEAALPEALDLMASSLEAGAPLAAAMELVASEGTGPLPEELGRVLGEHRLGEPLGDALAAAATRVGSRDFAWCVRAVRTQQEFGASLADLLRTLAEFMRWRQELRGEVSALTAEGRLSAGILSALPFLVGGFFVLTSPSYVAVLVTTPVGLLLSCVGGTLLAGGIFWMSRIVKVEV